MIENLELGFSVAPCTEEPLLPLSSLCSISNDALKPSTFARHFQAKQKRAEGRSEPAEGPRHPKSEVKKLKHSN